MSSVQKEKNDSTGNVCVPYLWPMCMFKKWVGTGNEISKHIIDFTAEAYRLDHGLKPKWITSNKVAMDLSTMRLRDFSESDKGVPVIIDAPFAGHSATIADYAPGQSLVRTLLDSGVKHLYVASWKSATDEMKDFTIDTYLTDLNLAVDEVGGEVHLIGLCQGGWMSAAYAARFPGKVRSLTLAGSPIDTSVGEGVVKEMALALPMSFYREMVALGGGRMLGKFMLAGWKNMHPAEQYVDKYLNLFKNLHDEVYIERAEDFARWYEYTMDLPGPYYLQAVEWLFKENRLAKGEFVVLDHTLSLKDITIPVYLLAGEEDDITPPEQVLAAEKLVGTPKELIEKKVVPGGHIGLFMGHKTLATVWPEIARWILRQEQAGASHKAAKRAS